MSVYTAEALVRALAPVKLAIDAFVSEEEVTYDDDVVDDVDVDGTYATTSQQARFISLLLSISQPKKRHDATTATTTQQQDAIIDWASIDLLPSRRYVHRLVQQYISSQLEGCNIGLEDDNLAGLVCHFSMSRVCSGGGGMLPDPTYSCVVTFRIPSTYNNKNNNDDGDVGDDDGDIIGIVNGQSEKNQTKSDIIHIRTYPHHNDVGVAKVWEAGACLAEFFLLHPNYVCDRNVVELGAGVGFTGLIVAGVSGAKSVHMTDYTEACMENLAYNVMENGGWVVDRRECVDFEGVTVGRLEWGEYSNKQNGDDDVNDAVVDVSGHAIGHPWANSIKALSNADVLIAGDVVYLVEAIPDLVATVCKFLSNHNHSHGHNSVHHHHSDNDNGDINRNERVAIFATTYRNKKTFNLFENELEKRSIVCVYHSIESLPNIFPCYFNQPRTDVRVCTMRMKKMPMMCR
mmetsp:Transcript_29875/g.64407  ORF Transcript_29875/g.64407 Transcript_29875/m.64407 type:complete len:460 (+) Transcript_29875:133-1512(+)